MLKNISKSFFINLDRRTDRRVHIESTLPFNAARFPARDGASLSLTPKIKKLFPGSWNILTKKDMARCLSHYDLWKRLTTDKEASNYLILEDDVVFEKGFVGYWEHLASSSFPSSYSLIYLGGCPPEKKRHYRKVLKKHNDHFCNVKNNPPFSTERGCYWPMSTQSYIISKTGASLLCQWVEQKGFGLEEGQAQDVFMVNFFSKNPLFCAPNSIYHLHPLLSRKLHEQSSDQFLTPAPDRRDLSVVWQVGENDCYERDWLMETFPLAGLPSVYDEKFEVATDNSIIIYSDIFSSDINRYPSQLHDRWREKTLQKKEYFKKFKDFNNCYLMHLSDEYCHADISHYKYFKHVFRNYFRPDAQAENVTFFPLGYKPGFVTES